MQSVSIFEVLATNKYPVQHLSSSLNCFTINFVHSRLKTRNKLYTLDRKSFTNRCLWLSCLFSFPSALFSSTASTYSSLFGNSLSSSFIFMPLLPLLYCGSFANRRLSYKWDCMPHTVYLYLSAHSIRHTQCICIYVCPVCFVAMCRDKCRINVAHCCCRGDRK